MVQARIDTEDFEPRLQEPETCETGDAADVSPLEPKPPLLPNSVPPDADEGIATPSTAERNMLRINEENECRNALDTLCWLHDVPVGQVWQDAGEQMSNDCWRFMQTYDNTLKEEYNTPNKWMRLPRLVFAELATMFVYFKDYDMLPKNLAEPQDKRTRSDAAAAVEEYIDPGNEALDVVVHVMQLWNLTDFSKSEKPVALPRHRTEQTVTSQAKDRSISEAT